MPDLRERMYDVCTCVNGAGKDNTLCQSRIKAKETDECDHGPGELTVGICSETWKKRCPESAFVVCGNSSVRSMGPPFQVDWALIFTLTPCFSLVAVEICQRLKACCQCATLTAGRDVKPL